jgi:hypothetical protein
LHEGLQLGYPVFLKVCSKQAERQQNQRSCFRYGAWEGLKAGGVTLPARSMYVQLQFFVTKLLHFSG